MILPKTRMKLPPILVLPNKYAAAYGSEKYNSNQHDGQVCSVEDAFLDGNHENAYSVAYRLVTEDWKPSPGERHPRLSKAPESIPADVRSSAKIEFNWLQLEWDNTDPSGEKREWPEHPTLLDEILANFPQPFGHPTFACKSVHGWHAWWALSEPLYDPGEFEALMRIAWRAFRGAGLRLDERASGWGRLLGLPCRAEMGLKYEEFWQASNCLDIPSMKPALATAKNAMPVSQAPAAEDVELALEAAEDAQEEAFRHGDLDDLTPEARRLVGALHGRLKAGKAGEWEELASAIAEGRGVSDGSRDDAASRGMGWLVYVARNAGASQAVTAALVRRTFEATTAETGPQDNRQCWSQKALKAMMTFWLKDDKAHSIARIDLEQQLDTTLPLHRLILQIEAQNYVLDFNDPTFHSYLPVGKKDFMALGYYKRKGKEDEIGLYYIDDKGKKKKRPIADWMADHVMEGVIERATYSLEEYVQRRTFLLTEESNSICRGVQVRASVNAIKPRRDKWCEDFLSQFGATEDDSMTLHAVLESWPRFDDRKCPALVLTGIASTGKSPLLEALCLFASNNSVKNLGSREMQRREFLEDALIFRCDDSSLVPTNNRSEARAAGDELRNVLSGQPLRVDRKYAPDPRDVHMPWRMVVAQNGNDLQNSLDYAYNKPGDTEHLGAVYKRLACVQVSRSSVQWLMKFPWDETKGCMLETLAGHIAWMAENPKIHLEPVETATREHLARVTTHGQVQIFNREREDRVDSTVRFLEQTPALVVATQAAKLLSLAGGENSSIFYVSEGSLWTTQRAFVAECKLLDSRVTQGMHFATEAFQNYFRRSGAHSRRRMKYTFDLPTQKWVETGIGDKRQYLWHLDITKEHLTRILNTVDEETADTVREVWNMVKRVGDPPKDR